MLFSFLAIFPTLITATTSAPTITKAETLPPLASDVVSDVTYDTTLSDASVLNFAQTLKYLSRALYASGLSTFNNSDFVSAGFEDPFYANMQQIYFNEQSQISLLYAAIIAAGGEPVDVREYEFPYVDVEGFVRLAAVVAGLEVSGYFGAAASISNGDYLSILMSILSVEARHTAYFRASLGESPFRSPFDTPLDLNETYTIVSSFIRDFNSSSVDIPVMPYPNLTLACTPFYYETDRSSVTFTNAFSNAQTLGITASTPIYAVFYSGLQKPAAQVFTTAGSSDYRLTRIPAGVQGQSYVLLSKSNESFTGENIIAGPAILEVYPPGQTPSTPHPACIAPSLGL